MLIVIVVVTTWVQPPRPRGPLSLFSARVVADLGPLSLSGRWTTMKSMETVANLSTWQQMSYFDLTDDDGGKIAPIGDVRPVGHAGASTILSTWLRF